MSIVKSESISNLVKALTLAKKEFNAVLKLNENPGFKRNGVASRYADLATAINATEDALLNHGLVVSQFPVNDGERVGARTLLAHESGEFWEESFTLPLGQQNAQTGVAAVTYARRTGYLAVLGIAAEDDDGNTVTGRTEGPDDPPDFHDGRHAAPRPAPSPKPEAARPTSAVAPKTAAASAPAPAGQSQPVPSTEINQSSGATPAAAPSKTETAPAAAPDAGPLPTEDELTEYRKKFSKLGDDLSSEGKLKSSKGLPINRKLLVFLLKITGAAEAKVITKAQWNDFFSRVDHCRGLEDGLVGLAKLVNKANGVEEKPKK